MPNEISHTERRLSIWSRLGFKMLDRYIIRQFLGTFFSAITLILLVSVVFDINEKIDKLQNPDCPLYEIIFDYYVNFVPYYGNMFAPLFVFISVIFFTTQMAQKTEIVAILSGGISFQRLLRPYLFSAGIIALLTFLLASYVIPPGNKVRNDFQNKYIKNKAETYAENIRMEMSPGEFLFLSSYNAGSKTGYNLAIDHFEEGTLRRRLVADRTTYDTLYHWHLTDYHLIHFGEATDTIMRGSELDTIINISPGDFLVWAGDAENLTTPQLRAQIEKQRQRGAANVKFFEIELHKRIAAIPAAFILTLIGVSLSSHKRRGGMGLSMAVGLSLSFTYILFMTVSATFAISDVMSPFMAAQLPNIIYAGIALYLYKRAPR